MHVKGVAAGGFGDCDVFPSQLLHPRGPMWSIPCHFLLRSARLEEHCTCHLSLSLSLFLHFTSAGLSGAQRLPSLPFKGMLAIIWVAVPLSPSLSFTLSIVIGLRKLTNIHVSQRVGRKTWIRLQWGVIVVSLCERYQTTGMTGNGAHGGTARGCPKGLELCWGQANNLL